MASDRPERDPLRREAMARPQVVEPAPRPFVHLRVHSAYSLLEGALPLGKVVGHAVKDKAPAIAMTDTNNLFGALEFAQKATKDGIQPIIGCQLDVAFGDENADANRGYQKRSGPELFPIVLIAATEDGYANLVRLVSRAYLENTPGEPVNITLAWVEELAPGMICLTGGALGPVGRAIKSDHRAVAEQRLLFRSTARRRFLRRCLAWGRVDLGRQFGRRQ